MYKNAQEIIGLYDEIIKDFSSQLDFDLIKNMNGEEFELMKKCLRLFDASKEYLLEQAKLQDETNKKLDKIIDMLKGKES